ncbi:SMI1/KNR4 family protein [Embleya sp. NBC_00896]|uniref:SMI1/KNR4 family protein n=1 Tax=Embleya sp. NBC_00896 TaxID=2975961 RepID=UPI00386D1180|nr:SMI1/KNR4 family protein [Embleya sp. NBC_00896]
MTFDIHAALPAALADRSGAWAFIRAFAADRGASIEAGDGYDAADLDASAARLGITLPAALRELYELVGRRGDLTSNHDVLLPPDKLYVEDGVLVFREENQGVAWWGVRPGGDDPAVIFMYSMADPTAEEWAAWLPRLSHAAIEMVLSETVLFDDELVDVIDFVPEEIAELPENLPELAFPGYPESEDPGNRVRWFAGPDLIARFDGGVLMVRARTEEDLETFYDAISGDEAEMNEADGTDGTGKADETDG